MTKWLSFHDRKWLSLKRPLTVEGNVGRVDRFLPIYRLMFVFSVAAWFPGGATLSQPCIRWPQPLTERLVNIMITEKTTSLIT